jgi:beta-lactamase class A
LNMGSHMLMHRRTLLAALPALVAVPAWGEEAGSALEGYERSTGGRIGLYAENHKTGSKIAWRADERFAMCSSFKASLAACVLARVDRGEDSLDQVMTFDQKDIQEWAPTAKANLAKGSLSVGEACQGAVERSDNTCANLLVARIGGPDVLTEFWRKTGDAVTRLDHYEHEMSRSQPPDPSDTTSPAAMTGSLGSFILGDVLSPDSRARLTSWMRNCKTGLDLLRAGMPKGWAVADKTGSNGRDVVGDIAVAWPEPDHPLIMAVYTQGGSAEPKQLRRVLADIGKLIGERLVA